MRQMTNPFLLQLQISQSIKKLSSDRKKKLGQAYLNVLNDFHSLPDDVLDAKYFGGQK